MRATPWILLVAFNCPGLALAEPCTGMAPFTDVPASASYCTNVEWLRNRSITLGCTTTTYCPGEPVTRAAMALFMNRLGVALTPEVTVRSFNGGSMDLDFDTFVCASSTYVAAGYPRRMHLVASFSAHTTAAAAYGMSVRYNIHGGDDDFEIPTSPVFQFAGSPGAGWSAASSSAVLDLEAGQQYRFAIRVSRAFTSGGTGNIDDYRCHLSLALYNRNAASAPLDVAGDGDAND